MLTNASTEGKAEPYTGAGASEQQNASQAYKFFFRLVTVPPTTRPLRLRTIVPSRLLGITNQERADIEPARLEAEQAERPGIRFEDLDEPEWVGTDHDYVKHYAKDRFHSGVYTMTTTPEIDEAARKIVALPKVFRAFQGINNNVERLDKNAAHIVNILLGLSDSVRKHFNVDQNDYGKFFEMDDWPIEVDKENAFDDDEYGTANIFVQGSKPPASFSERDSVSQYWSNLVSFIKVGTMDMYDWLDRIILRCLFLAGQMFRYRAFTSHIHFVTWSGHFVRLWYVNADMYGCSQIFDTRAPYDQIDIVKILILLTLEAHSMLLNGHWDLGAQRDFDIEADGVAHPDAVKVERQLQPLKRRPGPFRSGSAVFADEADGSEEKVLVVKASWLDPGVVWRELAILRDMQEKLKLPNAPIPIGLAKSPIEFQKTTSELATPDVAFGIAARTASVLLTKQRLGSHIGPSARPGGVVKTHLQLVEQLLQLAEGGFHYRDINDGNVRLLRGSCNTLLLIDYADVSKSSERGRQPGKPDTTATIDRARDDIRAAGTMFAPTCCGVAEDAVNYWLFLVEVAVEKSKMALSNMGNNPIQTESNVDNDSLRVKAGPIRERLRALHEALKTSNVYSHRYIDDLQSSLFLLLWNTAPYRGHVQHRGRKKLVMLEKTLLTNSALLWDFDSPWNNALRVECSTADPEFIELMRALRNTIRDARKKLTAYLSYDFERKVSLADVEKELMTRQWDESELQDPERIINSLFEGKGTLDENHELLEIERDCFNECIRLMKEEWKAMFDRSRQDEE